MSSWSTQLLQVMTVIEQQEVCRLDRCLGTRGAVTSAVLQVAPAMNLDRVLHVHRFVSHTQSQRKIK